MTVPNRVVLPAMDMNLCEDGEIEKGDIDHFRGACSWWNGSDHHRLLRCCVSAGLHQPQGTGAFGRPVHPRSQGVGRRSPRRRQQALCADDTPTARWRASIPSTADRSWVPSTPKPPGDMSAMADCTPEELGKMAAINEGKRATYHEATKEDLDWLVRMFAEAAGRVKAAGGDAVEIHCAHNYVLGAFLRSVHESAQRRVRRFHGEPCSPRL